MATRTVRRSTSANPIVTMFQQFMTVKAQGALLSTQETRLKKDLSEFADKNGTVEDEEAGHKVIRLPAPFEIGGKTYVGFMRQRRAGAQTFNEERAEALLKEKGIDRSLYITTQEYVDQDKVYRLYAEDVLTDDEMKGLLDQADPTWAFVPMKES